MRTTSTYKKKTHPTKFAVVAVGKTGSASRVRRAVAGAKRGSVVRAQIATGYPKRTGAMGELKNIDFATTAFLPLAAAMTANGQTVGIVGTVGVMNNTTVGAAANQRIGRKIVMKSLFVRGEITAPVAQTLSGNARIVILYDRQPNAAAPAATLPFSSLVANQDSNSLMNLDNRERFKVLMDIDMPIAPIGSGNAVATFNRYIKLNYETDYNTGNAGTIADITSGAVLIFTSCGQSMVAAGPPQISLSGRIRFSD